MWEKYDVKVWTEFKRLKHGVIVNTERNVRVQRNQGISSHVTEPNVTTDWLARLLRTGEVPGSNLGPETAYPSQDYR
jgi:hypothetical protein